MTSIRAKLYLYWAVPFLLFLLQAVFTLRSMPQLRYEELAESVRNVYWLEQRTIYDGFSSNIGWYGTILVIYRLFGFWLYGAKFVRLALSLISLLALASVFAKYLPPERAWLPLSIFGLSPTLLYFNTLQTSYGIDLQYFPITLYIVLSLNFSSRAVAFAKEVLLGVIAMWACLSFPAFLFYLPVLTILFLQRLLRDAGHHGRSVVVKNVLVVLGGFLLPLSLIARLKDPSLLIFDPRLRSGIFRGGGVFSWDPMHMPTSVIQILIDLFRHATSYYFEVASVDFSNWFPLAAVCLIAIFSLVFGLWRHNELLAHSLAWTTLSLNLIAAHLTGGPPGIRRATPSLAAIYALVAITCYELPRLKTSVRLFKIVLKCGVLLILVHHLLAVPQNYTQLSATSPSQYKLFFLEEGTPGRSLDHLVQEAQRADLRLSCSGPQADCRYAEVYAAVSGACLWNHLACHNVLGFDYKSQQFIALRTELWESYYLQH